jgi:hypothetical protein
MEAWSDGNSEESRSGGDSRSPGLSLGNFANARRRGTFGSSGIMWLGETARASKLRMYL